MHQVKNIITVQHPESVHHTNGMIGSWTDWPLTAKGQQQAANIAYHLKKELAGQACAIFTSPLRRTLETADLIAQQFNTVPEVTDALKERGLGKAIGQSVAWLKENLETEELTVFDKCFSDAESRSDVWQRLFPFYTALLDHEAENIILVSHGDTLSIFNVMWLGLELAALHTIDLYGTSGGVSILQQNRRGKRIIRKLSDTSYLSSLNI